MKITLRPVTKNDFPFLKKLYRSTREPELDLTNWTELEKDAFIEFQFSAQHTHYSQAYDNAEFNIIEFYGCDAGRLYLWETEHQIRIMDIAVLQEYRNKGIGTFILTGLINTSEIRGKKLNIHVEYNNPALSLYQRLGFKKTDDTGVYYFMERNPGTAV